jgi:single-strand DNA-binding protein
MNKVILVGRLCRDPELKNTTTGRAVATFTLAVDRRFKNKDGQKEADFVPIVVWGRQAEFAGQYLSKGSQIGVSGRLQVRSYDAQDGQRRYVTEVVANEINFILTKPKEVTGRSQQLSEASDDLIGLDSDFHLMANDDDIPF